MTEMSLSGSVENSPRIATKRIPDSDDDVCNDKCIDDTNDDENTKMVLIFF